MAAQFSSLNLPYWAGPSGIEEYRFRDGVDKIEAIRFLAKRHDWLALHTLLRPLSPTLSSRCGEMRLKWDLKWSGNRDLSRHEFEALEKSILEFTDAREVA